MNTKPIITKPKVTIEAVNPVKFAGIDGHTVAREKGQITNKQGHLIRINGDWVYRDAFGGYIDHDYNFNDLVERNDLNVIYNGKE